MIDSHHHLWNYSAEEYPWIPAGSPLAQNQLIPELAAATSAAGVDGTIVVQARQVIEESDWLLSLADETDLIKAVVGWVPLISPEVGTDLERLVPQPKFRAVRHVLLHEESSQCSRDLPALPALFRR
jgi:L-fuconolactonase